jgi:protein TonB
MLEMSQKQVMGAPQMRHTARNQQARKLMLALAILLVALVAILVNDRQFWFGSEQATIDSDVPATQPVSASTTAAPAQTASAPVSSPKHPVAAAKTSSQPVSPATPAVSTARTALPPLDVEVVAGDNHRSVHPASNVTKLEVAKAPSLQPEKSAASVTAPASDRQPIPVAATHLPQSAIHATYPVLAQHMNVQGSVVLEAIVGADGIIQNLKVLSGPSILATAAQQAVREWHFKPMIQNGQAVESKATITVNFSIKVGDSQSSTLAQSAPANDPFSR